VLGKLRRTFQAADPNETAPMEANDEMPVIAAPLPGNDQDVIKKVTVDIASTKAPDQAPRKRRIRLNPDAKSNEPPPA
jgi:hypothetical protein